MTYPCRPLKAAFSFDSINIVGLVPETKPPQSYKSSEVTLIGFECRPLPPDEFCIVDIFLRSEQ